MSSWFIVLFVVWQAGLGIWTWDVGCLGFQPTKPESQSGVVSWVA